MKSIKDILKASGIFLFNLKEIFYKKHNRLKEKLIRNTHLFKQLSESQFKILLRSSRFVKYPENTLICKEGEIGNNLFIIADGSVRVFTYDTHHVERKKIPLARLNKGDYFGEQALLGQANKTRTANIETITLTTLLEIKEQYITHLFQADAQLHTKLKKIGYEEALKMLALSNEFYKDLEESISQMPDLAVKDFSAGDVIFNFGSKPDNVYIILSGEVELAIPNDLTKIISTLLVYKGHLFGELGILENKPRSATAVARTNTRLLVIKGDIFKTALPQSPQLQKMLAKLQKGYRLPLRGSVEQYVGNVKDMGHTITNIYKMDDGRTIIALRSIQQNIFTMNIVNQVGGKTYRYQKGENKLELDIIDNHIVAIKAFGIFDDLPRACRLLLDNEVLEDLKLSHFEKTGELKLPKAPIEIICQCLSVTSNQIQELIAKGVKDFNTISRLTGVSTACRGCAYKVLEMLDANPWMPSILTKIIEHNSSINSYLIKPVTGNFKSFRPGQHVIIQVNIENNWVERPYIISDIRDDGYLRVTIKKEPNGFFTQWLFEKAPKEIEINVTQPFGDFFLNTEPKTLALCFANDIGVTPFIAFAKFLSQAHVKGKMHLIYSAPSEHDFIFEEELNNLVEHNPLITISRQITNVDQTLSEKEIIAMAKSSFGTDVYICGTPEFVKAIQEMLKKVGFDDAKMHTEQFVHAGITCSN